MKRIIQTLLPRTVLGLTVLLGFVALTGCAGGTRGTGVKTVRPGDGSISKESDAPYLDAVVSAFSSKRTATCETPRGDIFVNSSASIALKVLRDDARSWTCEVTFREADAVLQISLPRQLLIARPSIRVLNGAGTVVRENPVSGNGLTVKTLDIPPGGAVILVDESKSVTVIIKRVYP